MDWVNIALIAAAVLGVVNILDSHLISRRMPGLRVYILLMSLGLLVFGLVFFFLFPLPAGTSLPVLLVAVVSGILRAGALFVMLYVLKKEEVSRVVPIVYAYPIYVAIMAVPLLGEYLHFLEWLAIFIVVAGAILVSLRRSASGGSAWLGRPLLLLFGSSLLLALGDIASKYVLNYISSWNLLWLVAFCVLGVGLAIAVRPGTFRQVREIKGLKSAIALLALNEVLALTGMVLMFLAIQRGPVSLVSAIAASRPIFVLIFAYVLSRILPAFLEWQGGRGLLAVRVVATVMIVGGIVIIQVT